MSRSPFTRVRIGAPSDGSIEYVGSRGGCTSPIGAAVMRAKCPFASFHRICHTRRKASKLSGLWRGTIIQGGEWRATADEDGHDGFAVAL